MSQRQEQDICYIYRYHVCLSRRVFLNFNSQAWSEEEQRANRDNITVVTQLHYNRFSILLSLIDNWAGPMQARPPENYSLLTCTCTLVITQHSVLRLSFT